MFEHVIIKIIVHLCRSFTWVDDKGKKIRMSAHQYVEIVIVSVQKLVTDEAMFPTKYGMYHIL